jgi:hypothetical protein
MGSRGRHASSYHRLTTCRQAAGREAKTAPHHIATVMGIQRQDNHDPRAQQLSCLGACHTWFWLGTWWVELTDRLLLTRHLCLHSGGCTTAWRWRMLSVTSGTQQSSARWVGGWVPHNTYPRQGRALPRYGRIGDGMEMGQQSLAWSGDLRATG